MIKIYTDGASRGNPGPGGWAAIILNEKKEVLELGGHTDNTTNNRMEMEAAFQSLSKTPPNENIEIFTDSAYLLNGITRWVYGWQRNGWKTKEKQDVLNKDIWQKLLDLHSSREIEWKKVSGHSGDKYNDRADAIATSFALGKPVELFHGNTNDYEKVLTEFQTKQKKENKGKAYSYVSMVGGDIEIHKTWKECEERVKGIRGTRYRKALSPEDEKEIIKLFQEESK